MHNTKTVGIWIRVSTEDQAKGESPEHHEKRARMYAESKGWHVGTVYHLEGVSGKEVTKHHEAQRMMKDIASGEISGLIFSKLARLARNTKELLDFADYFREHQADLISLQEAIDTSSPAGRLFYTMIAAMAQWEREEISDRISASIPVRAKMGKPLGGQPSLGYKWENKKMTVDEKEAPVRKLIYELFLKNRRKKTTANELNKMGYRTRNGSMFSASSINRLLRDPSAKGLYRANHTRSLGVGKKWTLKPKDQWVVTPCPAIVSEETWNECNQILDEQLTKSRSAGPKAVHLLAGFVHCSCGKKMYVYHKNSRYMCKPCKTRIWAADIDEIYHEQLKSFLLTDTDLDVYIAQSDQRIKEKEQLLNSMKGESEKIRKRMDVMLESRFNGEISKETFVRGFKPFEEQVLQIDNKIPELEAEIDFLKIQLQSSDTVLREAKNLYDRWQLLPFEEKRAIVEVITNKITIGQDEISFSLAYAPSASLNNGKSTRDSHVAPTSSKPPLR